MCEEEVLVYITRRQLGFQGVAVEESLPHGDLVDELIRQGLARRVSRTLFEPLQEGRLVRGLETRQPERHALERKPLRVPIERPGSGTELIPVQPEIKAVR